MTAPVMEWARDKSRIARALALVEEGLGACPVDPEFNDGDECSDSNCELLRDIRLALTGPHE